MQERGIENTGLYDVEVVNTCEMDTDAIIAYAAIHNGLTKDMVMEYQQYPSREQMASDLAAKHIGYDFVKKKEYNWAKLAKSKDTKQRLQTAWLADKLNKNVGDICLVDKFPTCNLLTFSYPCTDLSLAGRQAGMIKGETRSGLVYEVLRILNNMKEDDNLPTFLLMENVDALVNRKNKPQYDLLNDEFKELGYECKWEVINGKNCGVPQNRKRIFAIYYLADRVNLDDYEFPKPFDTGKRLKDVLFEKVPDKYYITNEKAQKLINDLIVNDKIVLNGGAGNDTECVGNIRPADNDKIHQRNWVYNETGISPSETATQFKDPVRILKDEG